MLCGNRMKCERLNHIFRWAGYRFKMTGITFDIQNFELVRHTICVTRHTCKLTNSSYNERLCTYKTKTLKVAKQVEIY